MSPSSKSGNSNTPYKTITDSRGSSVASLLSAPFEDVGMNDSDFFGEIVVIVVL